MVSTDAGVRSRLVASLARVADPTELHECR